MVGHGSYGVFSIKYKLIFDSVMVYAKFLWNQAPNHKSGTKETKVAIVIKLYVANNAKNNMVWECTRIATNTNGDSTKTLTVPGLSVVGHDSYVVFPLKGKLLFDSGMLYDFVKTLVVVSYSSSTSSSVSPLCHIPSTE